MRPRLFKLSLIVGLLVLSRCQNGTVKEMVTEQSANILKEAIIAPSFTLESLSGKAITSKDYYGKFVVLHIATTWCPFCNAEAPYLEKLYNNYKDKNVEVLIIDVKEPKELVEEKLKNGYKLTFPILLDHDGKVAASFAPDNVLPELDRDEVMLASNIIIDPLGNIQFMSLLDSKNFDAQLIQLKKRLNELL